MAYNNADLAYILPDKSLNQGQMLGFLQNQRQLEEEKQQRLYQQRKRQEQSNLNTLDDSLDWTKYQTGEQAIDNYSQSEMQKIYKDALANHVADDPVQLRYWLQNRMTPLTQWHTMAKNGYKVLDQQLQDLNKTLPNIDYPKARGIILNQFHNDLLDTDENGNFTRKNTDNIKFSDYGSLMKSPEFLGQITNDVTPFSKFFYDVPKTSIGGSDYKNKKGFVNAFKWSGMMPEGMGELVTDEDNKPSSVQLRGEPIQGVTDSYGEGMKVLPEDIRQRLAGNPAAQAAAEKMWSDEKNRLKANGKQISPSIEPTLKSAFLYKAANQLLAHPVTTSEVEKTPKPTVNIYGAGGTAINDTYERLVGQVQNSGASLFPLTAADSDARETIVNSVNQGLSDNKKIPINKINIVIGNDGTIRALDMRRNGEVVGVFSREVLNQKTNPSVKQRQVILQGGNQQPQQPLKKSKEEDPLGIFK